jgi:hypothetical protein
MSSAFQVFDLIKKSLVSALSDMARCSAGSAVARVRVWSSRGMSGVAAKADWLLLS